MRKMIKKKVNKFIKENKLFSISYPALKQAIEKEGYTVVEFNAVESDEDVEAIIKNLNLGYIRTKSRGFIYKDSNYRLIFINEDINEEEKVMVLSHEIGHVVCGHIKNPTVIGDDVKEEYEANEFVHYLLNQGALQKAKKLALVHRKAFISAIVLLCVLCVSVGTYLAVQNKNVYTDNLYITSSGKSYHKKDCIFIKNKTNSQKLTKKDFESGTYSPCDICLPDKN